jgi:hypothetical protein
MTDAELAEFLTPDDVALGLKIVGRMTLEKRATYERMSSVVDEIALWEAGLGPKPQGVIMTTPRGKYRRMAR